MAWRCLDLIPRKILSVSASRKERIKSYCISVNGKCPAPIHLSNRAFFTRKTAQTYTAGISQPRYHPPHILEQHEEMHRIGRGGQEIEFFVEPPGVLVLCMYGERPNAGNLGGLERALHRVPQKRPPGALALPASIHRQPCQQHDGYWMSRQPFGEALGRMFAGDLSDSQGVIAHHGIPRQADVRLCGSRQLVAPG